MDPLDTQQATEASFSRHTTKEEVESRASHHTIPAPDDRKPFLVPPPLSQYDQNAFIRQMAETFKQIAGWLRPQQATEPSGSRHKTNEEVESRASHHTIPAPDDRQSFLVPPPLPQCDQNAFIRQMTESFRQIAGAMTAAPTSALTSQRPSIKKLIKYRAEYFKGRKEDDVFTAEYWLNNTERVLKQLQCTEEDKYRCAVSLLKEEAYQWWNSTARLVTPERCNWNFFLEEFRKKYISDGQISEIKRKFLRLIQGRSTVREYERDFFKYSWFAPEYVPTEEDRCMKFLEGLNTEINVYLAARTFTEMSTLVNAALRIERVLNEEKERKGRGRQRSQGQTSPAPSQSASKRLRGSGLQFTDQARTQGYRQRPGSQGGSASPESPVASAGATGRSIVSECQHCNKWHFGECWRLTGACLKCGAHGHYARDCPTRREVLAPRYEN